MIAVHEARKLVAQHAHVLHTDLVQLSDSLGYILAEDIISPIAFPPFAQSAMDGYAINATRYDEAIPISFEVKAGSTHPQKLMQGTCARIFTGAPIPEGTQTVVMQEHVTVSDNHIKIVSKTPTIGANIRPEGSQTQLHETVAFKGTLLNAHHIGLLSSLGISQVVVFKKPSITIITTGDELIPPGNRLQHGQIFESNGITLGVLAKNAYCNVNRIVHVKDDEGQLSNTLMNSVGQCDLLLITGGMSVGDYDYAVRILEKCGFSTIFHKVSQKPGKPLYFGMKDKTPVFGLPGNPGSVLTCYYEYVVPCIRKMSGYNRPFFEKKLVMLEHDFEKKQGLTYFMKAHVQDSTAVLTDGTESYKLNGFVMSNSMIEFDENSNDIKKGEMVKYYKFDEIWRM